METNTDCLKAYTISDAWSEVGSSSDPELVFPWTDGIRMRAIGQFNLIKRHFYSAKDIVLERGKLIQLIQGDRDVYISTINELSSSLSTNLKKSKSFKVRGSLDSAIDLKPTDHQILGAIQEVDNLFLKSRWGKCFAFNALIREGGRPCPETIAVAVVPASDIEMMFNGLILRMDRYERRLGESPAQNTKISGVFARDIIAKRIETGVNTPLNPLNNFRKRTSWALSTKDTELSQREVNIVLNNGVFDIKEAMRIFNRKAILKGRGWLYSLPIKTRNNDELVQDFAEEVSDRISQKHLECVEENGANLPVSAFEDNAANSIGSLEL